MSQDASRRPRRETTRGGARRRRSLFGTGLSLLEWSALCLIYGCVILGMCFLGATAPPYYLSDRRDLAPTLIYSQDGVLLAKLFEQYRQPVALEQVPSYTIRAVLASEDTRFFAHHGLDGRGILRACWHDLRSGSLAQGGSTLTQQLVRTELLGNERTLQRKVLEATLAVRVERTYTKEQILERYLNAVYFGGGAYGIGAAAQCFFQRPVARLTLAQSALLAGLIRAPEEGNPRIALPIALHRQREILATMQSLHWITSTDYQQALQEPITIAAPQSTAWRAPYVVEAAREFLLAQYGREAVYHGGFVVYTSIDSRAQRAAELALGHALQAGAGRHIGNGALIAIEPGDGYIRAMVGGANFAQSPFNRATQAHRQPGSAFKPFVYQAALEAGDSLADPEWDAPITVGDWSPRNYANRYYGVVTLQQALAQSLNSVAVRLTLQVGPSTVAQAAQRAGITSPLRPDNTIALGSSEVTPLEMAHAYGTFADQGYSIDPTCIDRIEYQQQVIYRPTRHGYQATTPITAFLLTQALRSVISDGTGQGARIGRPAAGKTGTSSEFRDAWFVGYTPDLCTAVWLGNDDRSPMDSVAGGSLPAHAWAEFMRTALRDTPAQDFFTPPGVFKIDVSDSLFALSSSSATHEVFASASNLPHENAPP